MECFDFDCLCCKKTIKDATDAYAMCSLDNVNDIKGDICETCFEKNSDEELFKKTGYIPCDSYSKELVDSLKKNRDHLRGKGNDTKSFTR